MPVLNYIIIALAAYLLGSIPTGFLVAKAKGIDIRTVGSGNIGATNAFRVLGKPAGLMVLLVDALKGWIAVRVLTFCAYEFLLPANASVGSREIMAITAGIAAVLGHNYTCWLKFKGGKGIATTAGVYLALAPMAVGVAFGVWVVLIVATRFVSVASMGAAVALASTVWLTNQDNLLLGIVTTALAMLAIAKHRTNIQRLLHGTESRIRFKSKGTAT